MQKEKKRDSQPFDRRLPFLGRMVAVTQIARREKGQQDRAGGKGGKKEKKRKKKE